MIATSSQTPPSAAPIPCSARVPCSTTSCRTCPNSNWSHSSNASPRCSPTNRSSPILSGPSENEGSLEHSGRCLSRAGGTSSRNEQTVQFTCDADPSREWSIEPVEGNVVKVHNVKSQQCLTIAG